MDSHFKEYFHEFSEDSPTGCVHKLIALHEDSTIQWEEISKIAPALPKAWYELSRLKPEDRIEFTKEYWQQKLMYHPNLGEFVDKFFSNLDEIGVFLIQKKFEDPFEVFLVYSVANDSGFYRGALPAPEDDLLTMESEFPEIIFPPDYLAFLKIHNGFFKTTDCTGLVLASEVKEVYDRFQVLFANEQGLVTESGQPLDPKKLIPFYVSFGMPYYHCFWAEWYPQQEMGVVYVRGTEKTVSDITRAENLMEGLAFPTFTDWLMFYLERIG